MENEIRYVYVEMEAGEMGRDRSDEKESGLRSGPFPFPATTLKLDYQSRHNPLIYPGIILETTRNYESIRDDNTRPTRIHVL